jgi:hypothetical protein
MFTARYEEADVRVAAANAIIGTSKASCSAVKSEFMAVYLPFGRLDADRKAKQPMESCAYSLHS